MEKIKLIKEIIIPASALLLGKMMFYIGRKIDDWIGDDKPGKGGKNDRTA